MATMPANVNSANFTCLNMEEFWMYALKKRFFFKTGVQTNTAHNGTAQHNEQNGTPFSIYNGMLLCT